MFDIPDMGGMEYAFLFKDGNKAKEKKERHKEARRIGA